MPGRIRRDAEQKKVTKQLCWKIGKYIRLSREDAKSESESESITNQRYILDDQMPNYFKNDDYTVIDEYIDDGRTGTSDDTRPEFQRLIRDVKSGKINCVITKNLSRAFRNSANQGKFLEEFIPLYNTRFISLYEPRIDTFLNPEIVHSLEVSITGFMNEQYAYKTSVDVRRTFDTKRRNGDFIGAFAPYGYKKSPHNKNFLIIDEEAASVVRDVFHWFVYVGMSKMAIRRKLNDLGIPNPTLYKKLKGYKYNNPRARFNDGLWSDKAVNEMLENRIYIGDMVQGKQKVVSYKIHDRIATKEEDWYIVENTHEPIIDKETFAKAQKLLKRDIRTTSNEKKYYLLSGILRCADCKKSMTRKQSKNLAYYTCSTYTRKSRKACTRHSVREDIVQDALLKAIQKQITIIESLAEVIDKINSSPIVNKESDRFNQSLKTQKQELNRIISISDSLYEDWKSGDITKEQYHRMKVKYENQSESLKCMIEKLEFDKKIFEKGVDIQNPYLQAFLKYKNIDHLERGIICDLVNNIFVHEDGQLTIEFNFADQHQQILEFIMNNEPNLDLSM